MKELTSEATHEVTGRGTVKTVRYSEGPFRAGEVYQIDGKWYELVGIEMTNPPGRTIGLIVKSP